jgi:hypothetical protein
MMFHMFRRCVHRIIEDAMSTTVGDVPHFHTRSIDATGKMEASYDAKCSVAIENLAYGVDFHTFIDYFQLSKGLAAMCCDV